MGKRSNEDARIGNNRILGAEEEKSTPLHDELGMTPAQIREDLINQGLDPAAEADALRRMGRVLAARYAGQRDERQMALEWMVKRFSRFDESASAGAAVWSAPAEPPGAASFMEVLERADAASTIWVRVNGWSMRDAGLQDGDLALVDTAATPRDGDIVVAHIAGEGVVVKRLRVTGDGITLESANPDFANLSIADPASLRIQGVVVGRGGKI